MPKNLLVADDSLTMRKVIGMIFATEDFQIYTVDNGLDAINKTRELHPDILLADVMMPGKSGYEVCEILKADPSTESIPIVLLAGTFEAFDENRARAARANDHITKPFESQVLIEKVRALVGGMAKSQSDMPARPTYGIQSQAGQQSFQAPAAAPAPAQAAPRPMAQPAARPPIGGGGIPPGTSPGYGRPGVPTSPGMQRPPLGVNSLGPTSPGAQIPRPGGPIPGATSPGYARPGGIPMGTSPGVPRPGMQTSAGPGMRPMPAGPGMPTAPGGVPRPPIGGAPGMGTSPGYQRPMPGPGPRPPPPAPMMPPPGATPPGGMPPAPARTRDPFGLGAPSQQLQTRARPPPPQTASLVIDDSLPEQRGAEEISLDLGPSQSQVARRSHDGGEAVLRDALSKASREVIEKIAWEVVPQLAETIIRQELDRLIKDRDAKN